jgi:hypothetical protein
MTIERLEFASGFEIRLVASARMRETAEDHDQSGLLTERIAISVDTLQFRFAGRPGVA